MFDDFPDQRIDQRGPGPVCRQVRPRLVSLVLLRAAGQAREHEEADRAAGRTVGCPTLFLWSTRDDMESLYGEPLEIWRPWAGDLRGHRFESGHHVAEENPQDLTAALLGFLR